MGARAAPQSVSEEADKLAFIRALALPADLFADLPSKVLDLARLFGRRPKAG